MIRYALLLLPILAASPTGTAATTIVCGSNASNCSSCGSLDLSQAISNASAGDTIEVTREDGTTAVFTVERGEQYSKDAFPTQKVYGNTEGSELRLITCDGYDPATGEFDDNYVIYAQLVI